MGLGIGLSAQAQNLSQIRPITTGAPFLRIAPDARSGGMADQGVAITPDVFSQYWNAAKYPFAKASSAVGVSYTPYMNKLINDTFLLYASYYTKLGEEDRSSISASVYYFNMGEINLSALVGSQIQDAGIAKPNEFSIDLAYALKLSDSFSMAVTGKFIRSDLSGGFNSNSTLKAANSFAVDICCAKVDEAQQCRTRIGWPLFLSRHPLSSPSIRSENKRMSFGIEKATFIHNSPEFLLDTPNPQACWIFPGSESRRP